MTVRARTHGALGAVLFLALTARVVNAAPPEAPRADATAADEERSDTPADKALTSKSASPTADAMYVIEQLVVGVNSAPGSGADRVATIKSGDRVEVLTQQGEDAQIRLANGTEGWVRRAYLTSEQPLQRRLQDRTAEVEKLKQEVARLQSERRAASGTSAVAGDTSAAGTTPVGAFGSASRGAQPSGDSLSRDSSSGATSSGGRISGDSSGGISGGGPGDGTSGGGASSGRTQPSGMSSGAPPAGRRDESQLPVAEVRDASFFMTPADQIGGFPWQWLLCAFVLALPVGFVAGWLTLDRRIRNKYGGLKIY